MPVYEYICQRCLEGFTLLQRIGTTEKDTVCPKCGSQEVKKKPSVFGSFKNAGHTSTTSSSSSYGGG